MAPFDARATMNFMKTTILGGLFILFPLLLFYLAIMEIAQVMVAMAEPIAELFPAGFFDKAYLPGILAAILLTLVAFLCGLLARSKLFKKLGASFERSVLQKLPMYSMLKSLSAAFLDSESTSFSPALVENDDGSSDPCYIVETHADGRVTVLLPWSPTSFAGSIKIVRSTAIRKLNCSLDEFSQSLSLMGVGVVDCINR
jgi:uncharacterized membrane protein